jgi:hypothetical protein
MNSTRIIQCGFFAAGFFCLGIGAFCFEDSILDDINAEKVFDWVQYIYNSRPAYQLN